MVRQRKKKSSSFSFPHSKRSVQRSAALSNVYRSALHIIGIRPLQKDAPLTPQQKSSLGRDLALSFVIFLLTVATRFYRLAVPDKLVFDEIHFAGFIHQYMKGTYLFDIHPPLGKLTLLVVAKLFGYKAIDYSFNSIGQSFGDLVFYPQRAFAALAGSLIPPVMYLTARALSLSVEISLTTAAMPLLDFLLCVESRLILTDSQLILYLQMAYLLAFLLWQTPRSTPRRYALLVATAIAAASALTTKWTAFVAPLIIAFVSLTGVIFPYGRLDLLEMGAAGVIAAVIYIGSFWIHFKLLPLSGPGDAFMLDEFQATLKGNEKYNPYAKSPSFLQNFRYLNWEMLRANSAITTRHPWESKWYEWLYNARGVLYSDERLSNGLIERIYIVVNPVLSLLSALGVFAAVVYIGAQIVISISNLLLKRFDTENEVDEEQKNTKRKRQSQSHRRRSGANQRTRNNNNIVENDIDGDGDGNENDYARGEKEEKLNAQMMQKNEANVQLVGVLMLLFVAWCTNLFPYIGITRCTFVYHVLPSLQVASLMTGIMLNMIPTKYGLRKTCCAVIVFAMTAAYFRWSPWIYALPRTESELLALRLLPRWD